MDDTKHTPAPCPYCLGCGLARTFSYNPERVISQVTCDKCHGTGDVFAYNRARAALAKAGS